MKWNSPYSVGRAFACALVMLAAATLCVSCSPDDPDANDPGPKAENNSKAPSSFADEIDRQEYKETEPPAAAPVFRWNFTNKDVHTYSYEQNMVTQADMGFVRGGKPGSTKRLMSTTGEGVVTMKSEGDGTAELVVKINKMGMKMAGRKDLNPPDGVFPPTIVKGVKEDGSGPFGNNLQDLYVRSLFPLPAKSLKVGESVDVPVELPFNVIGTILSVKGHVRITLTRYVKIAQRTCAQLDVKTDISKVEVPPDMKGEYKCSTQGTSVYYFDVAKRVFVSGTTALKTHFSIDAPAPAGVRSMATDQFIRVKLKE